jgi:hypothetical protein
MGQIELVRRNFEKVILGIIFVSVIPVLLEARKASKKH